MEPFYIQTGGRRGRGRYVRRRLANSKWQWNSYLLWEFNWLILFESHLPVVAKEKLWGVFPWCWGQQGFSSSCHGLQSPVTGQRKSQSSVVHCVGSKGVVKVPHYPLWHEPAFPFQWDSAGRGHGLYGGVKLYIAGKLFQTYECPPMPLSSECFRHNKIILQMELSSATSSSTIPVTLSFRDILMWVAPVPSSTYHP